MMKFVFPEVEKYSRKFLMKYLEKINSTVTFFYIVIQILLSNNKDHLAPLS